MADVELMNTLTKIQWTELFRKNRVFLVQNMSAHDLLDDLIQQRVMSEIQSETFRVESLTRSRCASMLIDHMGRRPPKNSVKFMKILFDLNRPVYDYLYNKMKDPKTRRPQTPAREESAFRRLSLHEMHRDTSLAVVAPQPPMERPTTGSTSLRSTDDPHSAEPGHQTINLSGIVQRAITEATEFQLPPPPRRITILPPYSLANPGFIENSLENVRITHTPASRHAAAAGRNIFTPPKQPPTPEQNYLIDRGCLAIEDEVGDPECVVCLNNKKKVVCIPCGHAALCKSCSFKIVSSNKKSCPICRCDIEQIFPVFV